MPGIMSNFWALMGLHHHHCTAPPAFMAHDFDLPRCTLLIKQSQS
jgi:hypothetical protein